MDAAYLSDLVLCVVDDSHPRPLYTLAQPFRYWSSALAQEITVPSGFSTDLASVPMFAMAIVGQPGDRAAVIHDWLVQSRTVDRRTADRIFLEALRVSQVPDDIARTMYFGVCAYTSSLETPDLPEPIV